MVEAYKDISRRKQADREALIPQKWKLSSIPPINVLNVTDIPRQSGILSPLEIEITEKHDASSLAEAIASKKYTAIQVTLAFCKRAAIAQQLVRPFERFRDIAID